MILQKTKQVLIFIAFLIFYIFASTLVQLSAGSRIPVPIRVVLFIVGVALSVLYVWAIIRVIRLREPGFSILPINFNNGRKVIWLIGMWLIIYGLGVVWSVTRVHLLPQFGHDISKNQDIIQQMAGSGQAALIIVIFDVLILAPVMEELLFRGLFLDYFDSRKIWWLGPIFSGIVFAAMHVVGTGFTLVTLVDMVPYLIMGIVLAYVYKKSGRISNDIAVHLMQNTLASLGLILTLAMAHH
ncbi:lysostaphin resistance A-like protein [Leuconostocaceae bacterium ESL0723]|nr:lysostaphin resistance A-like protein [Leuconostocaceae bacterium ESL0723]